MIHESKNGKQFTQFNWELYSTFYPNLHAEGYKTKEELWWHFVNIGESNGYVYFDINDFNNYLERYNNFDCGKYMHFLKNTSDINMKGKSKEELWWHYITTNVYHTNPFLIIDTKTIAETKLVKAKKAKKTRKTKKIFYFIHHTSSNSIRTGIQIVTIYLAKELIKLSSYENFDLIFVKWDFNYNAIVPCDKEDIKYLFHLDESEDMNFIENISCLEYRPIHVHFENLENCLFFCPEILFVINHKLPMFLKNYLQRYKLSSVYILYDIIPLVLPEYEMVKKGFMEYFTHNLLTANKIIAISNFTKNEFIRYCSENKLITDNNFPITESISLPYQYRDKPFHFQSLYSQPNSDKITILLPGTVEPRKQQIVLMKAFNKFIEENPDVDVELLVFGQVIGLCINEFFNELNLSNGKIKYLGIITNNELFWLYSTASFSCYISKYEGYGFPIAESLWHGTPVLTSNFGSMQEVATAGGCYCVDTNNPDDIYDALYYLITNTEIPIALKNAIDTDKLTTWNHYSKQVCETILMM